MSNNCKKHKINNVNHYTHRLPETDCICDVGITGPAGDPELIAKSQPPLAHPQMPPATGPAADPELIARQVKPLKHPETPEATGPAK